MNVKLKIANRYEVKIAHLHNLFINASYKHKQSYRRSEKAKLRYLIDELLDLKLSSDYRLLNDFTQELIRLEIKLGKL